VQIRGCHIDGNSTSKTGIRLTDAKNPNVGHHVQGNQFVDTFGYAIEATGELPGLSITNNVVASGLSKTDPESDTAADSQYGFYLHDGSFPGARIEGNYFWGSFENPDGLSRPEIRLEGVSVPLRNQNTSDAVNVKDVESPSVGAAAYHDGSGGTPPGIAVYDGEQWQRVVTEAAFE
jgi:hypothetical protein